MLMCATGRLMVVLWYSSLQIRRGVTTSGDWISAIRLLLRRFFKHNSTNVAHDFHQMAIGWLTYQTSPAATKFTLSHFRSPVRKYRFRRAVVISPSGRVTAANFSSVVTEQFRRLRSSPVLLRQ